MKLTQETLEAVLQQGDEKKCLALFKNATEEERRSVAEMALAWLKQQEKNAFIQTNNGVFTRNPLLTAAEVALLASCSLGQLRKLGGRGVPQAEIAYQILTDRRPPWIDDWVEMVLKLNARHREIVCQLVRDGLCKSPQHENYLLGMFDRWWFDRKKYSSLKDRLLDEPGFFDHLVWRLFEIEGGGEFSLAAHDSGSQTINEIAATNRWDVALKTLAEEGKLPRARLLDASLDTLERDFAQFRAGWFSRFHEFMQPTLEEREERTKRYLHLLASKIPPTVSFALNALTILEKADRLSPEAVVQHIEPALFARQKGTVQTALKMLDRAAKARPKCRRETAKVAATALGHEAADVQGAALDLIERHGDAKDEELTVLLRGKIDQMAASQRSRLQEWLGASTKHEEKVEVAVDVDEFVKRIKTLDKKLAKLAGVQQALAAVRTTSAHVPALEFDGTEIPRLDPDKKIQPIQDLDELIDCFAAVLENPDQIDDVERVLDGVSRLCDQRPDNFAVRVGPLRKRASQLMRRSHLGPFLGWGAAGDLCGLAVSWLSGTALDPKVLPRVRDKWKRLCVQYPVIDGVPVESSLSAAEGTATVFLSERALAVARRAAARAAAPLLSAPTHARFWIDPRALVERMRAWEQLDQTPDVFDQVQALLRLAPDHRAAALRQASSLNGEYGAAVRYALGATGVKIVLLPLQSRKHRSARS